ncbi:MAG: hypothetical protein WCF30_19065 [Terracidiphilus sp.]
MQPLRITVLGSTLHIDLNLVAGTCGLLALAAIIALYGGLDVAH